MKYFPFTLRKNSHLFVYRNNSCNIFRLTTHKNIMIVYEKKRHNIAAGQCFISFTVRYCYMNFEIFHENAWNSFSSNFQVLWRTKSRNLEEFWNSFYWKIIGQLLGFLESGIRYRTGVSVCHVLPGNNTSSINF